MLFLSECGLKVGGVSETTLFIEIYMARSVMSDLELKLQYV